MNNSENIQIILVLDMLLINWLYFLLDDTDDDNDGQPDDEDYDDDGDGIPDTEDEDHADFDDENDEL